LKLNLTRPIVFFDLETTGVDVATDHIVELCYIKVLPNGNEESKTMRIRPADQNGQIVHIPEASTAVHGIKDEDVADCPTFREVAPELAKTFEDCDFAGFNSNKFDVPLLVEEFLRAGINIDLSNRRFVDVQNIYHKLERRTLSAAYQFYCGKDLENAHSADADTRATLEVLEAQLDRYPDDLQNSVDFLAEFSAMNRNVDFAGRVVRDENGVEIINFGKYKGMSVQEVLRREPGYVNWVLQGSFALNTKQVFQRLALKYKFQGKL
jgi:DNA polymerase-3 subunit epsilon